MRKLLILLGLLGFWASISPALAEPPCEVVEADICEIRKHPSCGPIDLFFWQPENGRAQCGQVSISLTRAGPMPQLRRVRCYFYGENTSIRFLAENYAATVGPKVGAILELRNGALDIPLNGDYRTMSDPSRVMFENLGPAKSVIMKCNGYGPA